MENIEKAFTDIADAIREKGGTSETLYPSEMPGGIRALPSGGGDAKTFVAEYGVTTAQEIITYLDESKEPFAPMLIKRGNDYYTVTTAAKQADNKIIIRSFATLSGDFYMFTYTVTDGTWSSSSHGFQKKLESGTNIKTINSESVLGSGDLKIASTEFTPIATVRSWFKKKYSKNDKPGIYDETDRYVGTFESLIESGYFYIGSDGKLGSNPSMIINLTGKIVVPDTITGIYSECFARSQITELVLPDSVTEIGEAAFFIIKTLKRIVLPKSVNSFGDSNALFRNCFELEEVVMPDTLGNSYGYGGYPSDPNMDSYTGEGPFIPEVAFQNCFKLKSITIPQGVKSLQHRCFLNCLSLQSITLPSSIVEIKQEAFSMDPQAAIDRGYSGDLLITEIEVPSSVRYFGQDSFKNIPHITYSGEYFYDPNYSPNLDEPPFGALTMN